MPRRDVTAAEGRVIATRPSLCLLILLAAAVALAVFATAARAEPKQLTLTGTTPPSTASSPANSTTPLIRGGEEGVIKASVPFGPRAAAILALSEPANVVRIYTDPNCEGTPVKTGTLGELEGAGIQVEVPPDSVTDFYATQTEGASPGETSQCSSPALTYYESSTATPTGEEPSAGGGGGEPPASGGSGSGGVSPAVPVAPAAPRIHMFPAGPANDNTPSVFGSAPGADELRIFASQHCGGPAVADVPSSALATGVTVQVPDNSETAFSALALAGGAKSNCSEPVAYVEDSAGPITRITMGPGAKTRRRKVVFRFADVSGDPPGTTFKCRLDRRKWRACHSPFKVKHLGYRRHILRVRGTDAAGNPEKKPVKRSFKVVHGS